MKETKTAKGGSDCPTLLHYLARILLRTDPSVIQYIEDLPNLEPAARGMRSFFVNFHDDVIFNLSVGTNDYSICKCFSLGLGTNQG